MSAYHISNMYVRNKATYLHSFTLVWWLVGLLDACPFHKTHYKICIRHIEMGFVNTLTRIAKLLYQSDLPMSAWYTYTQSAFSFHEHTIAVNIGDIEKGIRTNAIVFHPGLRFKYRTNCSYEHSVDHQPQIYYLTFYPLFSCIFQWIFIQLRMDRVIFTTACSMWILFPQDIIRHEGATDLKNH